MKKNWERLLLVHAEDAEDVVQEAIMKMIEVF